MNLRELIKWMSVSYFAKQNRFRYNANEIKCSHQDTFPACVQLYTRASHVIVSPAVYPSATTLIILSRADHFASRLALLNATRNATLACVCSCNNRVNNLVESEPPGGTSARERERACEGEERGSGGGGSGTAPGWVGVFHRDLGIKYLHDSSFASVYTT